LYIYREIKFKRKKDRLIARVHIHVHIYYTNKYKDYKDEETTL